MAERSVDIRGYSELNEAERAEVKRRINQLIASGRMVYVPPTGERFPPVPRPGETIQWNGKVLVGEPLPERPMGILRFAWKRVSAVWRRVS